MKGRAFKPGSINQWNPSAPSHEASRVTTNSKTALSHFNRHKPSSKAKSNKHNIAQSIRNSFHTGGNSTVNKIAQLSRTAKTLKNGAFGCDSAACNAKTPLKQAVNPISSHGGGKHTNKRRRKRKTMRKRRTSSKRSHKRKNRNN